MRRLRLFIIALLAFIGIGGAQAQKNTKRILFVVTSTSQMTNGHKTGYFLSEVAHPWKVLHDAGYVIDFVSPKGGQPPVDAFDLTDPINKEFWDNKEYNSKINHSMKPSEVKAADYSAIYYAGGHGAMFDLPTDEGIAMLAAKIYEAGGVLGAVCHGPAGLVGIKLSNGKYLVDGKHINSFTNTEEDINGSSSMIPFLLESKLKERGAIYEKSDPWQVHVVSDQRVVTGQNPMSATSVGEGILYALKSLK